MILNFICFSDHPHSNFSLDIDEKLLRHYRHPKYGACRIVACPLCRGKAKHIGYKTTGMLLHWELDQENGPRTQFGKDTIQRYREGQLSREFVETYPKQIQGMIKEGVITKEQVRKSKPVWKGVKGLDQLPYSGIAQHLGKD